MRANALASNVIPMTLKEPSPKQLMSVTNIRTEDIFEPLLLREVVDMSVACLQPHNTCGSLFQVRGGNLDDISVMGNKDLLKHIIVSLVYNVCQFNHHDEEERELMISIHKLRRMSDREIVPEMKLSTYVAFTVTDTAPHRHRNGSSTISNLLHTLKGVGVGLGLSVTELLTSIHGGIIVSRKQSREKDGLMFTVCLPVVCS